MNRLLQQCLAVLGVVCCLFLSALPARAQGETFSVALTGKYPPFSFYSNEGNLVGFDVDVSYEIARRLAREPQIITTEWDGILAGLLAGRFDAIIGSMAITEERAQSVDFSDPYYISGAQLFSNRGSTATTPADMQRIGVVLGTTYESYLRQNFPTVSIRTYKGDVDVFQEMNNGRIDGFVTDRLVGMYQIAQSGMEFVPVGELLYDERIGIPIRKGQPELLSAINGALAEMEADGTFKKLHEKWFEAPNPEPGTARATISNSVVISKIARGFAITLWVAFASIAIGFLLAIPVGVVLNGAPGPLRMVARAVVDFLRGTPVLIQLFFVYFGAPQVGIHVTPIGAAILTLSVNSAAYMAEVVRSGLMAVDPGQDIAGRSLGMSRLQVFRFIVWPQAFRIAIPPLMNSVVALLKDTALISVISVSEVITEAQSIIAVTYDPLRYYFIVAVMFFLFTFPLMKLAGMMETRMKERGFKNA